MYRGSEILSTGTGTAWNKHNSDDEVTQHKPNRVLNTPNVQ